MEIRLTVRPPRRVLFVPVEPAVPWQLSFAAALSRACGVWGGVGDLVFPLDATTENRQLFWDLAAAYDADTYLVDQCTLGDFERLDPALLDAHFQLALAQTHSLGVDREGVFEYVFGQPVSERGIGPALATAICRRLCPMGAVANGDGPIWNLGHADSVSVADLVDLPAAVGETCTSLGADASLLLVAELGLFSPAAHQAIGDEDCVLGTRSIDDTATLGQALYSRPSPADEYPTPWGVSGLHLDSYNPASAIRRAPLIVRGDGPWDFALYYALRRMHGPCWWAPSWVWSDETLHRALLTAANRVSRATQRDALVVSSSDRLEDPILKRELSRTPRPRHEPAMVEARWEEVVPETPARLAESGQITVPQSVTLQDGAIPNVPTPLPVRMRHRDESSTDWIVELSAGGWAPIRHLALVSDALCGDGIAPWAARLTREGVAWQARPAMRVGGQALASSIVRPTVRPTPIIQQIVTVMAASGWSVRASDKGAYAQRAEELFGGAFALADALTQPWLAALLFAYLSGRRQEGAPGRWLSAESRRVLALSDLGRALGQTGAAAGEQVHELTSTGVLQLGTLLKCSRCRQTLWYDIEAFGRSFTCARCRMEQPADRDAWAADEPGWWYRLDEALLQFVVHNGDLPLAAISALTRARSGPVQVAYELELTSPDGVVSELDIAAVSAGDVYVGEATTQSRLGPSRKREQERLRRLSEVAGLLGARYIVNATSTVWDERTRSLAARGGIDGWPRPHVLEEVGLVPRPDHCVG